MLDMIATVSKEKWLPVYLDGTAATTDTFHNIDDSLTSLNWLQTFSIFLPSLEPERQNGVSPSCPPVVSHPHCLSFRQGSTHSPSSLLAGDTVATGVSSCLGNPVVSNSDSTDLQTNWSYGQSMDGYPYIPLQAGPQMGDDETKPEFRPLYTYASLICMAMQASKRPKVTVSFIYDWIMANFGYYRHTQFNWQRSIRYTLSKNKCFLKVRRGLNDQRGKGGYWRVNPQYAHMFVNGVYNGRKVSESYLRYRYNIGLTQNGLPLCGHDTVVHGQHTAAQGDIAVQGPDTVPQGCDTTLQGHEQTHGTDILQESMASIFDGVPILEKCNTFEELFEELVSSYCEKEASATTSTPGVIHTPVTSTEPGQGVVEERVVDLQSQTSSQNHYQSYGYTELSGGAAVGYPHILHMSQQQHPQQDLLTQDHHQFQEASTPFPPQPKEEAAYPWGEQSIPMMLDQDFLPCDSFLNMLNS